MRLRMIACLVALASPAAADRGSAYQQAARLAADDDNEKALALVEQALASAPKDLQLLELNGNLLLKMRDYEGALKAYQSYLDAGAIGASRRAAQRIVASLVSVKSSFLELAVANGPAAVYLDSRAQGVFCTASPGCKKGVPPGEYKVIVERDGYARWTRSITVELGKTAVVEATLVEKPSPIAVHAPAGATITLDGAPYGGAPVAAGSHELVVALAGHGSARRTVAVHRGAPADVTVQLVPLVPIRAPAGATLTLDGAALAIESGGVPVPPGAHVLVARAAGFHDARVAIPDQRPRDYALAVELQPVGALVDLAGAPRGARLVVDGVIVATAPLATPVELAPGAHTVEVRGRGFHPYRDRGAFAADKLARIQVTDLRPTSHRNTYRAGATTFPAVALGAGASWLALRTEDAYATRAARAGVTASDPTLADMKSTGEHYALAADLSFGAALAGAAALTYFILREHRSESRGTLSFRAAPSGAGLAGRF